MLNWYIEKGDNSVKNEVNAYEFPYPCESHEICYSYKIFFQRGKYKIELWGAQGGNQSVKSVPGGKGAFVSGILSLSKRTKMYLFVGASGIHNDTKKVFGGGGKGSVTDGGSGGGATDLRYSIDDYSSRIIVAAGGAGSTYYDNKELHGGDAGGLTGYPGENVKNVAFSSLIQPGCGGIQSGKFPSSCFACIFGYGDDSYDFGSGGGGGYYGGGKGAYYYGTVASGGGGSSYISGYPGCANNNLFRFQNPLIKSGKDEFLSPYGENEIGNSGNGYARITCLSKLYICTRCVSNNRYFIFLILVTINSY